MLLTTTRSAVWGLRRGAAALEQAVRTAGWRELTAITAALTGLGVLSGVLGIYRLFFLVAIGPAATIALRHTTAACVLVSLTSPLVAVGAVDLGFHLAPCYLLIIAGLIGAAVRREWRGLRWHATDVFATGFGVVAATVTLGTLGTAPLTTVVGATGANGRLLRSPAQFAALMLMLGLYALMRMGIRDRSALHAVVRGLLVSFLFVALYTAYQLVARLGGLPYAYVNDRRSLNQLPLGRVAYVRVNGTLPEASPLAQFSFVATTCGAATLLGARTHKSLLGTRLAATLLALGLGILVASLSKAAIAAAAIVIPIVIVRSRKWQASERLLAGLALATTAAVVVGGLALRDPSILRHPNALIRSESYLREGYWSAAVNIAKAHPLGVGVGDYTFYYPRFAPISGGYEFFPGVADAHSWYLEALAETGILGGALFVAFVLAVAVEGVRGAGFARDDREIIIGLGAAWTAGALMHLTYSFFYYPFEWVIAGVIGAASSVGATPRKGPDMAPELSAATAAKLFQETLEDGSSEKPDHTRPAAAADSGPNHG